MKKIKSLYSKVKSAYARASAYLNGKKTAIGVGLVAAPYVIQKSEAALVALGVEPATVATLVGAAFAVIGIIHKIVKWLEKAGILKASE